MPEQQQHDTTLYLSLKADTQEKKDLCEMTEGIDAMSDDGRTVFRSHAAKTLREEYKPHFWVLKEGREPNGLNLKVAVINRRVAEFRRRVEEMGFAVNSARD